MTVLPLSGSKPQELLFIATEHFELFIKGVPENKNVEAFRLHQDQEGRSLKAALDIKPDVYPVYVYDPGAPAGRRLYHGDPIYPCFFEQKNYELVIEKKEGCPEDLALVHPNKKLRQSVTPTGRQGRVLSGIINFGDEVGFSRFEVQGNGRCLLSFELEVFPGKMDYQKDFNRLLQDVNEEVYNLAFDFLMKTYFTAGLRSEEDPSPVEFYAILQIIYRMLLKALDQVARQPHQKITPLNRIVRPEKVKKTDAATVKWLSSRSYLMEQGEIGIGIAANKYLPRKLLDRKKERSFDTFENRFLKWIIIRVIRKLRDFSQRYQDCYRDNKDPMLLDKLAKMLRTMERYCASPFLREVGSLERVETSSLVMQMAPGYREVFKYHLMLLKGLNVQSDLFNISLKNTAELYEYWCFLKLNSLLRKKYYLERNDLITVDRQGIAVHLRKGKESELRYVNRKNGERFSLIYNRVFTGLPTTAQKPDNMLILKKQDSSVHYHFIFDAKYRLAVNEDYVRNFRQPGPPEDTINTMHRYRDAILSGSGMDGDYQRNVFGAFVLFPHNYEMVFAGKKGSLPSRFYESIEVTGIGALPFLPSQTLLVENLLDDLFRETPETAFERTIIQEGTVDYLDSTVAKNDVLIGPLGQKEQLNVCLENNMYYTYLNRVQSFLGDIRYIAIYQSKRKFKAAIEQGIFYYGEISGFNICKRKEIKEMPPSRENDKEKLVVRFTINKWDRRNPGILAGGYGPASPQRTGWRLFNDATIYPELHLNPMEVRLWRELRRLDECVEVHFPKDTISSNDKMEWLLFPGLKVWRTGPDSFNVKANGHEEIFNFSGLRQRPGKTLRQILRFWQENRE